MKKNNLNFTIYFPKNPPAIALYEKLGFTQRRFEKDFYGDEEDRFILTRRVLSLTTPSKVNKKD